MLKNEIGSRLPNSRGSIVCTSSSAAIYPFPVSPLYSAAKSGIIGLVRSMAIRLKEPKIQINALAPGVLGMFTVTKHLGPANDLWEVCR